jgi:hypothetical protein
VGTGAISFKWSSLSTRTGTAIRPLTTVNSEKRAKIANFICFRAVGERIVVVDRVSCFVRESKVKTITKRVFHGSIRCCKTVLPFESPATNGQSGTPSAGNGAVGTWGAIIHRNIIVLALTAGTYSFTRNSDAIGHCSPARRLSVLTAKIFLPGHAKIRSRKLSDGGEAGGDRLFNNPPSQPIPL